MSTDLIPITPGINLPAVPTLPTVGPVDLYPALLADARTAATRQARTDDVADLGRFLGAPGPVEACAAVIASSRGQANAIATAYLAQMQARQLGASTINRRLSTLRAIVRLANRFELVAWSVDVPSLKVESYRDTRGPGHTGWVAVLEKARKAAVWTDHGKRDLAILRLLHDHLLRRCEVHRLDLADWDPDSARLYIHRKGRTQKVPISVNNPTCLALAAWVDARGSAPGPLFTRLDNARGDELQRISLRAINDLVAAAGEKAGLKRRVKPHGLRHAGITRYLERSNGNIVAAQKAADHKDPKTTTIYNDNRADVAGEVFKILGDDA